MEIKEARKQVGKQTDRRRKGDREAGQQGGMVEERQRGRSKVARRENVRILWLIRPCAPKKGRGEGKVRVGETDHELKENDGIDDRTILCGGVGRRKDRDYSGGNRLKVRKKNDRREELFEMCIFIAIARWCFWIGDEI
ncbi:hypothetical protein E2C01_100718 [Portunus trituberculatus]|uniref:Uncharacterized protein n=1 Tax=Portunus trituberculatus TaxID=210409 RepID=A0A5B7K7M5_PORTR|nr:hypothetical protein [Portunus trituberculatus]